MKDFLRKSLSFGKRLFISTGGQVGVSVANLFLSFMLMIKVSSEEFGTFSFVNVLIFLGFGVSNALLSSPLMVALNRNSEEHNTTVTSFFAAGAFLGLVLAAIVFTISLAMTEGIFTPLQFALSALFLFGARLGRTYLCDTGRGLRVMVSDWAYALVIIAGIGTGSLFHALTLEFAVAVMMVGAICAFLVLGSAVLRYQWLGLISPNPGPFLKGFQEYGRHALVGVLTTEATGRAHAYIVTLFLGPAAFAPLAAAALFFRPVNLVLFSLAQFERARIARMLRDGQNSTAWRALRFFYTAGVLTFIANVVLIVLVMAFFGEHYLSEKYDLSTLTAGITLFAFIAAFQSLRGPLSTLLQANADFALLSKATVISSIVTVPLVALMVSGIGAVWSLAGVAVGELVAVVLVYKYASKQVAKT